MGIEIVRCSLCRIDFDADSDDIATYQCPNCAKRKPSRKILDSVSLKYLTELNGSDEDNRLRNKIISSDDKGKDTP